MFGWPLANVAQWGYHRAGRLKWSQCIGSAFQRVRQLVPRIRTFLVIQMYDINGKVDSQSKKLHCNALSNILYVIYDGIETWVNRQRQKSERWIKIVDDGWLSEEAGMEGPLVPAVENMWLALTREPFRLPCSSSLYYVRIFKDLAQVEYNVAS